MMAKPISALELHYPIIQFLINWNIFLIQKLSTVMQLFKGSFFSVAAGSRHFMI